MTPAKPETMTSPSVDEVFTLLKAAVWLQVSEKVLQQAASDGKIPARKIGGEWRFLKSALMDWLREGDPIETSPEPPKPAEPRKRSKEQVLAFAGRWADDPHIEEIVAEAYRRRGRPMLEEAQ